MLFLPVKFFGPAEIGSGPLVIAQRRVSLSAVQVGHRKLGIQFQGPRVVGDRSLILFELEIGVPPLVVRESIGGVLCDLTIQLGDHLL